MQSIAQVSEVSTKTLYNLFGSRDQLLLEAASERLFDLERSELVRGAEPGIPRLLAFMVGAMQQFEDMPEYARAVISIIVRADLDAQTAYIRMGPVQRFAFASLQTAHDRGELRPGLNLEEISYLIAAKQWGVVLLWEKGLLALNQLRTQVSLGHYLTLIPLSQGLRRQALENDLNELLAGMAAPAHPLDEPVSATLQTSDTGGEF